jgi:hypothetical protein
MSRLAATGGEGHSKEAFMAEDKTTPESATPEPEGRRHGPGPLLIYGLVCLVVAAWCAYDLFSGKFPEERQGTIWINWLVLALSGAGAAYFFVLAAKRSKKPPAADTTDEA